MTDIRKEAHDLIDEIQNIFQGAAHQANYDTIKFQENLSEILTVLQDSKPVDNKLLISLEKFYQRTSLLIGVSSLEVSEELRQAWRSYDQFHYNQVKPNLRLYGPVGTL
ncbi:helicase BlpT [Streptococcus pneumoniae]